MFQVPCCEDTTVFKEVVFWGRKFLEDGAQFQPTKFDVYLKMHTPSTVDKAQQLCVPDIGYFH